MKKALFFDVDGTITHNSCGLPQTAVDAIRQARKNGHLCFLCTGRPYGIVPDPVIEIGFDGAVCGSGCMVRAGEEYLLEKYIDVDVVKGFVSLLDSMNLPYNFEAFSKAYQNTQMAHINQCQQDEELEGNPCGREFIERFEKFKWIDNMSEYDFSIPITKICFRASEEDLKVVRECADKRLILNTHSGEFMGMRHTEVIQTGFDKGNGVEMLLLHFNISKENSIGFGDSMNDVDMFKNVGYSVAMGNCAPKLRELADFVTLPVWDDGLKKALEKLELS